MPQRSPDNRCCEQTLMSAPSFRVQPLQIRQVTVFGGSGFVGTQVVRALARLGYRVRVGVRRPHLAFDLRPLGDVGQIQPERCDIRNPEDVARLVSGSDAVVNLVGILHEGPGRKFRALQVDGPVNIAAACRDAGITRLVQMSAIGADEGSDSTYAATKGEAERRVREIVPGAIVIRPSIIFGAGDGFLNRFATLAGFAPALPLIDGGHTRFQPVFVGDVAEAVARCVSDGALTGRTFELGGPATYSFREILELIMNETGRRRALVPLPGPVARFIGWKGDLIASVGITPPLTLDQVKMLAHDNVVAEGAEGFEALGITPTGLKAVAPTYLWRYRRGGQFAARPAPAPATPITE